MGSYHLFLFTYLLGGVTFLPAVICLVFLHAYLTLPSRLEETSSVTTTTDSLRHPNDDEHNIRSGPAADAEKLLRGHDPEVAEGYFAVCREYVPGGQNGKPPERTTPAGEVVAGESPSVYQSMYRSIFDRKQIPTLDPGKSNGKTTKRAANVFYITLRHSHLILFDDSEQLEVRHVISLNHHDVSIYGGGNEIPEGELWIKRNAICLTRKANVGDVTSTSKPFYLFSENCSEKEDFYFALLQNQDPAPELPSRPPKPQQYEVKDIISLVQRLHSSEDQLQTRWINALVGRLFLALYKTQEIEDLVRLKITKKIARVKKPAFLSGIILQKIDLGEAAPYITNPRLRDLTVDGNCCVEADFKYNGHFRLEIAATARIDLGTRFKAREVNLVLAVVLKKLEGRALVRLKPPPSNRVWITFEKMPNIEMTIEPIISSRQITYGIILRAIESRIREVVAETLVLPHWDDSPFTNTLEQHFRGGIWASVRQDAQATPHTKIPDEQAEDEVEAVITHDPAPLGFHPPKEDRSMSMPTLVDAPTPEKISKKNNKSIHNLSSSPETSSQPTLPKRSELPKAIRTRSFASVADPIVSMDNANIDAIRNDVKAKQQKDAASSMIAISHRSHPASPAETPVGSPTLRADALLDTSNPDSAPSVLSKDYDVSEQIASQATSTNTSEVSSPPSPNSVSSRSTKSTTLSESQHPTALPSMNRSVTPSEKRQAFPSFGVTAAAAKKWGWSVLNRGSEQKGNGGIRTNPDRAGTPEHPIGRGRPLPPVGQPLPPPDRRSSTPIAIPKRKALPPPNLPQRRTDGTKSKLAPPPLPNRRTSTAFSMSDSNEEGLLVVKAPPVSEPTSPLGDNDEEFIYQMKVDPDEAETATSTGHGDEVSSLEDDLTFASRPASASQPQESDEDDEKRSPNGQKSQDDSSLVEGHTVG